MIEFEIQNGVTNTIFAPEYFLSFGAEALFATTCVVFVLSNSLHTTAPCSLHISASAAASLSLNPESKYSDSSRKVFSLPSFTAALAFLSLCAIVSSLRRRAFSASVSLYSSAIYSRSVPLTLAITVDSIESGRFLSSGYGENGSMVMMFCAQSLSHALASLSTITTSSGVPMYG